MSKITTREHIHSSIRDAIYTSLNIGLVESYFVAFMITLGISEVVSGMGTVIPQFIGVIFQLFSIRTFFRRFSLKGRLQFFLGLQALSMIPLIMVGYWKINSAWLVVGILAVYWASLMSLNPPWNRLMGHTIPTRFRLSFFSIRSQFAQASVFIGLITTGLLLEWAQEHGTEINYYVGILTCGLLLKFFSWYEVRKYHQDYEISPGHEPRLPFRVFLKRLKGTDQGKLITFLFFFYLTVYTSAPYYTPYMLGKLKFSYLNYMMVIGAGFISRVMMFKLLQKWAKPRQINRILIISATAIVTSPLCWSLSQNLWWIVMVEFLSGCYWAGFELSTVLLYYQKIEDHERTSILTYITFLNTTGMIIGTVLGALYMKNLPPQYNSYIILFATSSFLRGLVIIFAPHVDFKGRIPKLMSSYRLFGVRPTASGMTRPVMGKVKKEEEE